MSKSGQIKRKDIISNDALNWTNKYSKSLKKAIKLNRKFINSLNEIKEKQSDVKPTHNTVKIEIHIHY